MKSTKAKRIWTIAAIEIKKYFRQPMVIGFGIVFPSFWIILNGAMFGNNPSNLFGGIGTVDYMLPAFVLMILLVTGLSSLPIALARNIDSGAIKRYTYTPLQRNEYISGLVVGNFLTSFLSVIVMFLVAKLKYDIHFPPNIGTILLFIAGIFVLCIGICSLGILLASVINGFQSTLAVSLLIYFVLLFLSGCTIPLEVLPKVFRNIGEYLPFAHMVNFLRNIWLERNDKMLLYTLSSIGTSLLFFILALSTFRWSREK